MFGLRPNKSKTIRQKNLKKSQVLPRGSCEHFTKFTQSWKTYHFIEKSILKNFSGRTRFDDALARISPIYSSEFSLYRVRLQKPAQSEALGRRWGGDHEVIKRWRPMKGRLWHMDAGQVQEGENGGRRIHRLSHYYLRIYYYRRSTSWSPPFNFPMERREFTRVIFLSSLARVSTLLRIIPFRICFALSNF